MGRLIIFVLGYQGSGKSTIIRALTGARQIDLRDLRSKDGKIISVLVNHRSPQERGCEDHPPDSFPQSIEELAEVGRDDWDMLVSALQYTPQTSDCPYEDYIKNCIDEEFKIKIAFIERKQNRDSISRDEVYEVQEFCKGKNIPLLLVDAALDPNAEANKIRDIFYPIF